MPTDDMSKNVYCACMAQAAADAISHFRADHKRHLQASHTVTIVALTPEILPVWTACMQCADVFAEAESDTLSEDGNASLINSPGQELSCSGELMSDASPSSNGVSDSASAQSSAFIACSSAWCLKPSLPDTIAMLLQTCLESLDQLPCQEQWQDIPLMCSSSSNRRTKLNL